MSADDMRAALHHLKALVMRLVVTSDGVVDVGWMPKNGIVDPEYDACDVGLKARDVEQQLIALIGQLFPHP